MSNRLLSSPALLVLAVVAVVLLAWWWRSRDRHAAIALGVAVVLLAVFGLYQVFRAETPAEQMERKLKEMAAAVQRKDVNAIFQHVTDDFHYGPIDKAGMQRYAQQYLTSSELTDVVVWDFHGAKVNAGRTGEKPTATIEFMMKPKGAEMPNHPGFRCVATFVRDADGQWRLQTFQIFLINSPDEYSIPQLPNR